MHQSAKTLKPPGWYYVHPSYDKIKTWSGYRTPEIGLDWDLWSLEARSGSLSHYWMDFVAWRSIKRVIHVRVTSVWMSGSKVSKHTAAIYNTCWNIVMNKCNLNLKIVNLWNCPLCQSGGSDWWNIQLRATLSWLQLDLSAGGQSEGQPRVITDDPVMLLLAGGCCWQFWGGGCADSRCQGGASQEMNPAWPLPASDLHAHVSLEAIASGIAGTQCGGSVRPGFILWIRLGMETKKTTRRLTFNVKTNTITQWYSPPVNCYWVWLYWEECYICTCDWSILKMNLMFYVNSV